MYDIAPFLQHLSKVIILLTCGNLPLAFRLAVLDGFDGVMNNDVTQVGATGKGSIGYQSDDEEDNISELNPYFCELTGLYWAWKHIEADN